jgi:hypothetical protein
MSEQHTITSPPGSQCPADQQPDQPEANGHGEPKARSGYGRLRNRHHRLIAEHEALRSEYYTVLEECGQWRRMYCELKSDLEAIGCGKEMSP